MHFLRRGGHRRACVIFGTKGGPRNGRSDAEWRERALTVNNIVQKMIEEKKCWEAVLAMHDQEGSKGKQMRED